MAKKSAGVAISSPDNNEWQAREDMRTLIEAKRIMKDKKRLAAAKAAAKKQLAESQEAVTALATTAKKK